jgi:uncharacterized protein (DUF885 family)
VKARLTLITLLAAAGCGPSTPPPRPSIPMQEASPQAIRDAAAAFQTVREGFLEWYYEANPVRASELGIRLHDARLTAVDRPSIQRRIDALLDWQADLRRIPVHLMREDDRADYAVLDFALRAELLSLEEVRRFTVDPRQYTDLIARGIVAVVEARNAPAEERVEALRGRLAAAPDVLATARENLRSPARAWTELAIAETRGLIEYVEDTLPGLLAGAGAPAAALEPARSELVTALREHVDWLENSLLPASTGDFRLGRYLFARILHYDMHADMSVQELERLNEERIVEHRERLEAVAAEIDPTRGVREILDSITRPQLDTGAVLPTAGEMMMAARAWTLAADVVTVPGHGVPDVRSAPPFRVRGLTGLVAPGPFDDPSVGAAFLVALPSAAWPEARRRGHSRLLSPPALQLAAVHETFPGEYVRRLHGPGAVTELARVFTPRTFEDGWRHYAEQMAVDEGLGDGDPAVRLLQLRRALHGHALWYASLHLHALGAPIDRVVQRFMRIAEVDEEYARNEVIRVTYDPLLLAGALGRTQIMELRATYERYQEERDEAFVLKDFHDRLLQLALPLPLATEGLMPSPPARPASRMRP